MRLRVDRVTALLNGRPIVLEFPATLVPLAPMTEAERGRFWSKVEKEPGDGCWLWTAGLNTNGYGVIRRRNRQACAHRWSYVDARGPIPDGLVVDHLCGVKSCVRPGHLEAVTQHVNMQRAFARLRESRRRRVRRRRRSA